MPGRIWSILRKIAMVGPTKEEMQRMIEEDRKANTLWIPSGRFGVEDCFMEFGARREDYGYSPPLWDTNEDGVVVEDSNEETDKKGTKAGTGSAEPDTAEDGRDAWQA